MFNRFFGGGSQVELMSGGNVVVEGVIPGSATASITFNSDGSISAPDMSAIPWPKWHMAAPLAGIGAQYQIRVTATGSPAGPALNTLHSLGTARTWSVTKSTTGGSVASTLTVEILDLSGNQLDIANFTIQAILS